MLWCEDTSFHRIMWGRCVCPVCRNISMQMAQCNRRVLRLRAILGAFRSSCRKRGFRLYVHIRFRLHDIQIRIRHEHNFHALRVSQVLVKLFEFGDYYINWLHSTCWLVEVRACVRFMYGMDAIIVWYALQYAWPMSRIVRNGMARILVCESDRMCVCVFDVYKNSRYFNTANRVYEYNIVNGFLMVSVQRCGPFHK